MAYRIGPLNTTVIKIGNQLWKNRNLDVTTYRNGDSIPEVTDPTQWANLTTGAWCYYNNNSANGDIYGKLYNWYAINDPRGLAPVGWRIPSKNDWNQLSLNIGTIYNPYTCNYDCNFSDNGAIQLKETGTTHWVVDDDGNTNSTGFTALPGGVRLSNGNYRYIGDIGVWWNSTEYNTSNSIYTVMFSNSPVIGRSHLSKKYGHSVRCIKD